MLHRVFGPGRRTVAAASILLLTACAVHGQDASAERDALVVETILRLEQVDLDAKPRTKEAVLRWLNAHPGEDRFFDVVERFRIHEAAASLLSLAVTRADETAGVRAARLLLELDPERVDAVLDAAEADAAPAAALVTALGAVGGRQAIDRLDCCLGDARLPPAVRAAAAAALGRSRAGGDLLLSRIRAEKLPAELRVPAATALAASPDAAIRAAAAAILPAPTSAEAKPLPPLGDLARMPGDAARGGQLFATRAACATCHVVGGTGKDVGPNLSAIGAKLPAEALLVAILDPSAGISHNYETFIATTEDGRTVHGLLVSRSDDEVVIKDAAGVVHTLAAAQVEELTKSPLSLMPSGLEKTMTAQELADLVAYLVSLKTP